MNIRTRVFGVTPSTESPLVRIKQPSGARQDELLSIRIFRTAGTRGDTRLEARSPMFPEPARVTWNGSVRDVQLANVTAAGAMILADFQPMLWDRLQLHLDDEFATECTVVWIKGRRVGLEFATASTQ